MKLNDQIRRQLKTLAASQKGIAGPRPLQRVIRDNLNVIRELRTDGATWVQIAALLHGYGLRSRRHEVISADVLRVLFSRAAAPPSEHLRRELDAQHVPSRRLAKEAFIAPLNSAQSALSFIIQRADKIRNNS